MELMENISCFMICIETERNRPKVTPGDLKSEKQDEQKGANWAQK
jgi:hypothetical protein